MLLLQPLNISEPLPKIENDAIAASIDPNPPCSNNSDVLPSVILSSVCFLAGLAVWSDNEQDFLLSAARGDV